MVQPWPRITIITPSYNQGAFIEETIRSVLLQGYPHLEYIIIDGGSTDDTLAIIKKYEPWITYWVTEKDRGQSHALNKGFSKATGEILGWLNSDDLLTPGALAVVGRRFSTDGGCRFLAGTGEIRDTELKSVLWTVRDLPTSFETLLDWPHGRYLPQPSVFFSRHLWEITGPIAEDLHYAMDLDYWLRLSRHTDITTIPDCLSWMRQHEDAKTYSGRQFAEVSALLRRHGSTEPLQRQLRRRWACRTVVAESFSERGFRALVAGNRRTAAFEAARAALRDPLIMLRRRWLSLLLRLVLPSRVRSLVFNQP